MNLTKLRELSALSEKATPGEWSNTRGSRVDPISENGIKRSEDAQFITALVNFYRANESALMEMERNSRRYRWLRDEAAKSNSLHLDRNGAHACNYVTAAKWIEEYVPDEFINVPAEHLQAMKDADTIWHLQIYPNTPVGFNSWDRATLDAVIDAALDAGGKEG